MTRVFLALLAAIVLPTFVGAQTAAPVVDATPVKTAQKTVMVIPVRDEIDKPVLYLLRRGLKEAIDKKADAVVLDMETPGGRLDVTFDIMEALGKFEGDTLTYVNKEAVSAGAFISATTDEIWFAPDGVIGAAAPVTSEGKDVDVTMKQKVVSYLKARVRAISEGKGYRGEVISAMIDADFELKVGDKVLKEKGELLSLTATEASKTYGEPPHALLAAGIAKDIDDLLTQKYGAGNYTVQRLEPTWSEGVAQYLNAWTPLLLGLGLLAIFIEFKTPGFGFFGITGGVLLGLVFFGHYIAGLSGHEPVLVFILGVGLVFAEILFFPGVFLAAVTGIFLMLVALVWSMADLWPNEPVSVAWSGDAFAMPLQNLAIGLVLAAVLGLALARYLPKGWVWDKMVVGSAIGGVAQMAGVGPESAHEVASLIGKRGIAVTVLRPGGQVEIDGRRYEATVEVGAVDAGDAVIVRGRTSFALIVERAVT
ncbi:MAG: NfeD family protein [Opitutaceae bacterium]|jgi:membrane-bound serine protease (ClpP class)